MLGSGTSTGVPRVGGREGADWGQCDPAEPRNRRRRVSALVRYGRTTILIDTAPDLREQLIDARVTQLDAVVWTHDHADHCHGIDDLRPLRFGRAAPIPGFADESTLNTLRDRFDYVFAGQYGYPSVVDGAVLVSGQQVDDVTIRCTTMPHGPIQSQGLRFDTATGSVGYATDFSEITADMNRLFDGVDVLVVDALRRAPHPSHPSLEMVLDWLPVIRPGRALLTHLDFSMDYGRLTQELPDGVECGYDGLRASVG